MPRRWRHYGDGKRMTEQRRRRENRGRKTAKNDDGKGLIAQLRSTRKPRRSLLHASVTPKMARRAPGTEKNVAGDEMASVATVPHITKLPFVLITPKFM